MADTNPAHASPNDTYTSPLASRNASPEMLRIWSPRHKFDTWRRIWLAVAEAQREVTKDWDAPLVSEAQVEELRTVVERGITDEEIARASAIERDLRHDVMAHVHCLGEQCPTAKPIIHLGCTSQDVVCNADLVCIIRSLRLTSRKIHAVQVALGRRAGETKHVATLGFTHYQTAQPVTVGRRLAQYAYELELADEQIRRFRDVQTDLSLDARGLRGATGTEASFLALFDGDHEKVGLLNALFVGSFNTWLDDEVEAIPAGVAAQHLELVQRNMKEYPGAAEDFLLIGRLRITGQTYPRIIDAQIIASLASTAAVLHKIATDIRLLSNRKEIDEPFGDKQIGSSAMPYKRNPMKCERICGLTRFVMNLVGNAYDTAATQWLERTLDDSSNRRLSLPEAFLALDGALDLMHQVASGLIVHEAMVRKNLMAELPFLATENILMEAVKAGGDRQELHERIRVHAQDAGMRVKQEGLDNDLIERLRGDPAFEAVHHLLTEDELLDPMKYVGRSVEQTERFLRDVIEPLRERYGDGLASLGGSDRGV
ncbi:MAG: lyase family protein [Planctomycetota bacterium]